MMRKNETNQQQESTKNRNYNKRGTEYTPKQ